MASAGCRGHPGSQMAVRLATSSGIDARHRDDPEFDDWLRSSHGFRVLDRHGRLGTVRSHRYHWDGSLDVLVLSRGPLRSSVELAAESVDWVLPEARTLLVGADGALHSNYEDGAQAVP